MSRAFSLSTTARLAGGCYFLTIVTGMAGALATAQPVSTLATLLSFACYLGVTLFMYRLFAATHPLLCLVAAGSSVAGCALGVADALALGSAPVSYLVFFGIYCLLVSYFIWRSALLPHWLGGLLALAGLGWLAFLWPWLAHRIAPYPMVSGLVGEGALTLWLLLGRVPYVSPEAAEAS